MTEKLQAVPQAPIQASGDVVRDQDKIMLVLAYLGILSLIPLLTVKDSDYVKFHARQGLALFLCWIPCYILAIIPILNCIIVPVISIGFLVLVILGIVKAFKPERWRIPVVSSLADKFA